MNFFSLLTFYNYFLFNFWKLQNFYSRKLFKCFFFLTEYYRVNELIWQEGLLVDFLQKKLTDNWVKKFLIVSSYLFNERLIYDKIIKFYLNLIIWPSHRLFIFEFNNVANTLFIIVFFFLSSFCFMFLMFFLMF